MRNRKNTVSELDKLFQEVGRYRNSKEYDELLKFVARFRNIAPFNAMLIQMQKPGSKYVASVKDWAERFQRKPKPGARPLVILRPFGPVQFVYELNDTEGKTLPEEILNPFKAHGEISLSELEKFIKCLFFHGIEVYNNDYGTDFYGNVEAVNKTGQYTKSRVIYKFRIPFAITINKNHDFTTQLTSTYHELGHIYCGHLYTPDIEYLPERYNLPLEISEFEAESVCWLICERQGIKNPSAEYLSRYLNDNKTIPSISIDTVLKAVTSIEEIISHNITTPRKELLLKHDQNTDLYAFHQITLS
ncbi:MAG: hypothetical protein IJS99_03475 [Synergistaceae bacterium]|nr:hypothetical protein [Synergistaceae bacterium]